MVKILAIGNSFSEDATTFLHDLAACGGSSSKIVNLFIGGCSLETHADNIRQNRADYLYERDGKDTGRKASVWEALLEENWDAITVQQASHFSGLAETYQPYLDEVLTFIKKARPDVQIYLHQTWSYETDSDHPGFEAYGRSQERMYRMLKSAYAAAAGQYRLPLIPSGDVIQKLRGCPPFDYANGGLSLCRDGYHMNLCYGRYAVAAAWYETLFGGDIRANAFLPDGVSTDEDLQKIRLIQQVVHHICRQNNTVAPGK